MEARVNFATILLVWLDVFFFSIIYVSVGDGCVLDKRCFYNERKSFEFFATFSVNMILRALSFLRSFENVVIQ